MSLSIKQIDNLIFNKRKKTEIKKWDNKIDSFFGKTKLNSDLVKEFLIQSWFTVACDDSSLWVARYGEIWIGFQPEVRMFGTHCLDKVGNCEVHVYDYENAMEIDHLKFIFRLKALDGLKDLLSHEDMIWRVGNYK